MASQAVRQAAAKSITIAQKNNLTGASVITGAQIRAARALLRWSAGKLAEKCEMSEGSILNAEKADGVPARMLYDSLLKIKTALEKGGVEFDGGNGGVRLRPRGRK